MSSGSAAAFCAFGVFFVMASVSGVVAALPRTLADNRETISYILRIVPDHSSMGLFWLTIWIPSKHWLSRRCHIFSSALRMSEIPGADSFFRVGICCIALGNLRRHSSCCCSSSGPLFERACLSVWRPCRVGAGHSHRFAALRPP